jgi:two-component system chemotaxis response regulator CheY
MKILVADDDRVTRRLLEVQLRRWGYDVVAVSTGLAALEEASLGNVRIVILDWLLPDMAGLDVCRQLRLRQREGYLYIVFLTSRIGKDDVVTGLAAGADDYIAKPFRWEELRCRLGVGERIIRLETELREANRKLAQLARTDGLTGLLNHTAVLERLEQEVIRARRESRPIGLILADLDHFKQVNDEHGHQVGDQVLKRVAELLQEVCRPYDGVGRYGGEEFLIVAPGAAGRSVLAIAERMREAIEAAVIETIWGPLRVTISAGASWTPSNWARGAWTLLHAADQALYRAKSAGRNRVLLAVGADYEYGGESGGDESQAEDFPLGLLL